MPKWRCFRSRMNRDDFCLVLCLLEKPYSNANKTMQGVKQRERNISSIDFVINKLLPKRHTYARVEWWLSGKSTRLQAPFWVQFPVGKNPNSVVGIGAPSELITRNQFDISTKVDGSRSFWKFVGRELIIVSIPASWHEIRNMCS